MSINQFIKPSSTQRNGNLYIGGCDTVKLAEKYGTPLYVIDESSLRTICREYKQAFKNFPNIKMLYASKAMLNMAIARIIEEEGFGFDTVSEGEIYTVYKAGINMSNVMFNGNNKSEHEIELAIDCNVGRFSVDNPYELELLNRIAKQKNKKVDILLRITPGIECHTHEYIKTGQIDSKFGFNMESLQKITKKITAEYKNLNLKGLHAHIGSQIFELESFKDEINVLAKTICELNSTYKINLDEVNIGGGLGVKYTEEDTPPSVKDFADTVISSLNEACKTLNITLKNVYIEPGRSIISNSGVTLYKIGSSKNIPNVRKYVSVDGGMADNPRPAMYGAKYLAEIANNTEGRQTEIVTIAGRFCESGDILIEDISLPEPKAGDILCVYNTGAYNYSMASNYNRVGKSAMVLVNNSQSDIIVNRESLDKLTAFDIIPDRLKKND